VIAASFQNKSMTSEFQKLFGPASPLADRRKAQAMNPRADLKYFVAESLRKAGELEEAVSQALVCVVWKRPGTERLAGHRRLSHER